MAALVIAQTGVGARVARSTPKVQAARPARAFAACKLQKARQARSLRVYAKEGVSTATGAGTVNDATFEELVLKSPVPVLLDFWAPWCGPCRMIAPLIDELAKEYGDQLRTLKINTDESPSVASTYNIRSIPTVMIFKSGQKMDAVIGAVPKATLVQVIEKYL